MPIPHTEDEECLGLKRRMMISLEIKNNVKLVDSQPRAATQISSFSSAIQVNYLTVWL